MFFNKRHRYVGPTSRDQSENIDDKILKKIFIFLTLILHEGIMIINIHI